MATPIAIAALGAGLDAALSAAGVTGNYEAMSPQLLVADVVVTVAGADLRLYRRNSTLGKWIPSAVLPLTCAVGVHELRWITAEIPGEYALVNTSATGTVSYEFRKGRDTGRA